MPYIGRVKQITSQMRKIESQMCAAVQANKTWTKDNTMVLEDAGAGCVFVFLHGNKIAEVGDDSITLFDGGWQSNTTKSRLNALLSTFGYTCGQVREYVFQRNFEWFVNVWDDNAKEVVTLPFEDGMVIA